jgi:asparagine N-glycosylation enzyme membrane subunit Stt3
MRLHVIFAGMLDDPYMDYVWLLLLLSLMGALVCFYHYKLGYFFIPVVGIVAAIFLRHFLERDIYRAILQLSDAMPRLLVVTIGSFFLPVVATYSGWRRLRHKPGALA